MQPAWTLDEFPWNLDAVNILCSLVGTIGLKDLHMMSIFQHLDLRIRFLCQFPIISITSIISLSLLHFGPPHRKIIKDCMKFSETCMAHGSCSPPRHSKLSSVFTTNKQTRLMTLQSSTIYLQYIYNISTILHLSISVGICMVASWHLLTYLDISWPSAPQFLVRSLGISMLGPTSVNVCKLP